MVAMLGEIELARYAKREMDDKWQIEAKSAPLSADILRGNLYDGQLDAERAIKHLIPEACRGYIRFLSH